MADKDVHTFKGLGSEIHFPFPPYGIQKVMMNKVTSTLMNKEHSLIESPTGTGKTLVLLCSSLAWQKKSKTLGKPFLSAKMKKTIAAERREKLMNKPCTCGRRPNRTEMDEIKEAKENSKEKGKGDDYLKGIPCAEKEEFFGDLKKPQPTYEREKAFDDNKTRPPREKERAFENLKGKPFAELMGEFDEDESATKKMKMGGASTCSQSSNNTQSLTTSKYFKRTDSPDSDCVIIDDEVSNGLKLADDCQIVGGDEKGPKNQTTSTDDIADKIFCVSCAAIDAEDRFSEVFGEDSADTDAFVTAKIKAKIPRIYYGTRTHKQITQVIRELNKTPYKKDLRMCILSSRERTCINDEVKDSVNRNDLCRDLLKSNKANNSMMSKKKAPTGGCPFHRDQNTVAQIFEEINSEFDDRAWDIEDAAKYGRDNLTCPYFGARALQEQADITFSPYNYLLDPTIRKNLNINLSNAIVIFDEAHNIEDICRESASFVIDTKQIDDILETINIASSHYIQGSTIMDAYQFFRDKFLNLKSYLLHYPFGGAAQNYGDFLHKKILSNLELLNDLRSLGLGPDSLTKVKENLKALRGDDDESGQEKPSSDTQQPALSFNQMQFITQLCITLDFMYATSNKYLEDFKGVVTQSLERNFDRGNHRSKPKDNATGSKHVWHFSLLCMNSGIAFEKIHSLAWSVIVASGTLSPIESLKTELGCQFSNIFEGAHVIGPERMFASIVSRGPSKTVELNCSYQNSLKLDFQDEVGYVVRDVCTSVPNGVLCFFPSYDRMESFYQRWFTKGIITEIQRSGKILVREQKKLTVTMFEQDLDKYNRNARMSGAVLFAVFRGKVSEGIDFADEAARAVITIGIPYPNVKETVVGLKRDYNDVARRKRPHLMTGGDWYSSQAFRALNQALGRCIRHKDDWGAIIMIDSRLNYQNNVCSISKWLRRNLQITNDYTQMRLGLTEFVNKRSNDFGALEDE